MSVQVKRRRDTASFLSTFTGAVGELIVDTTNKLVQVHDGVTAGGWLPNGKSPAPLVQANDASAVKHGGGVKIACAEELLTLSGATVDSTITFPNQCLILGVSLRVVAAITGATSFDIGRAGGTANEFGNDVGISAGTTNSGILGNPNGNYASTAVRLTANGGNFTGGQVRVQLTYLTLDPPTS
ncbi:MAG: hypothetical protein L0Y57_12730 [Beijerinckiaceae bacterium]|nr:hypothetical protein [Beijerinckiaceae bacterium]